jgi:N-acetylmuramoyl-L-alanine amidase
MALRDAIKTFWRRAVCCSLAALLIVFAGVGASPPVQAEAEAHSGKSQDKAHGKSRHKARGKSHRRSRGKSHGKSHGKSRHRAHAKSHVKKEDDKKEEAKKADDAKPDAPASPVARDARLGGDLKLTVFVADLSAPVDFRAFTLVDPYRVIIDLPEVKFQMPGDGSSGSKGMGLVSAFRYGLLAPGKSRIVIDVVRPVKIEKAFVREPENGFPARLVVHLAPTSREEFLRRQNEGLGPLVAEREKKLQAEKSSASLPGAAAGLNSKIPTIVIDPGHGGIDPGTIGRVTGTPEKVVVFAFATELKKRLESTGRFKVLMTRETDVFVPLDDRTALARTNNAELFISIHADALDANTPAKVVREVRGATIYTLSEEASDEEAKASAARENRSDLVAGLDLAPETRSEVATILMDLVERETKNNSVAFARGLIDVLKGKAQLQGKSHRFANFRVLKAPDVPSVLFELGYLSNADDEKLLTSEKWRTTVAEWTSQAITTFLSRRQVRLPF